MDERVLAWRAEADRWQQVNKATSYTRKPPNLINLVSPDDALRSHILQEISRTSVKVPEQDVYFLSDAYVSDLAYIYRSDGRLFTMSLLDQSSPIALDQLKKFKDRDIPALDGPAAYLFKAGKNNYGHLVVEMLPKLELLVAAGLTDLTLVLPLLPGDLAAQIKQIISEIYGDGFRFYDLKDPLLRVRDLIVPGPVSKHNNEKSLAVATFADRLISAYGYAGKPFRRIYLSRSLIENRRMINEEQIEAIVEAAGFQIVRPECFPIRQQIRLFSQAREICGALGAGMTNMMFSLPETHVITLSPGMYDFFFYDLASLRGQTFSWVFTDRIKRFDVSDLHRSYACNGGLVEAALRLLRTQDS